MRGFVESPSLKSNPLQLAPYYKLIELGWYPFEEIDAKTTGKQVVRLQERLRELGYFTGETTGKYDKNTSNAFSDFMKASGLKAGKSVTIEHQELLFSDKAIPKIYTYLDPFIERYNDSLIEYYVATGSMDKVVPSMLLSQNDFEINLEHLWAARWGTQHDSLYDITVNFDEKYNIVSVDISYTLERGNDQEAFYVAMLDMFLHFTCAAHGIDKKFISKQSQEYLNKIMENPLWEEGVIDATYNGYEYDNYRSPLLDIYGVVIKKK